MLLINNVPYEFHYIHNHQNVTEKKNLLAFYVGRGLECISTHMYLIQLYNTILIMCRIKTRNQKHGMSLGSEKSQGSWVLHL